MPRLPQPGGDSGNWGTILNDYLAQTHKSDGTLKDNIVTTAQLADNSVTAAAIQDGTITESQLDTATQNKLNTAGSGNVADGTITTLKLQDGAVTNAKVSATAAIAQSKIAGLTTDLAGKAATSHTHTAADITDATATGRAVLTATDAAAARAALGAGTSNLVLGTSNTTAAAGNDSRLSDTRVPTDGSVSTAKLQDSAVTSNKIANGTIVNADIAGSAAIDQAKVANLTADLAGKANASDMTKFRGQVANEAAMLALGAAVGDWCLREDTSSVWILTTTPATSLSSWSEPQKAVPRTSDINQIYGTNVSGNQTTTTVSAAADAGTIVVRDGSGRIQTATPTSDQHAATKAYVDAAASATTTAARTGVFQFEHANSLITAGATTTYQLRRLMRVPHKTTDKGFRIHLRNRNHLTDTDGGAISGLAIYIGEAAVDGTGEPTGAFATTPVQVQASTSVAAGAELISGWIAPATFQINPYKLYVISYTFTVAAGVQYAAGGGRFWYTTQASDVGVVSPAGLTRVDNQGILSLYVEYQFADSDSPVVMIVSNSIAGGGNVGGVPNRGELGAWPSLWALREKGVAASLAVGGAWCSHFTTNSPKWNVYNTLEKPLDVDAVLLFAITSSDVTAGSALADVRAALQATVARAKALWPTARIIISTNSPRADSSGSAESNRVSFNRELASSPYGIHQSIEIDAPFTDWANPERLREQFQGAPSGLGSSVDAIHWSEAAHSVASTLIPVKYGATS